MGAAEPEMTGHPVSISQIAGGMLSPCLPSLSMGRANGPNLAGPIVEAEPATFLRGGIVAALHSALSAGRHHGRETAPATGESADHRAVVGTDHAPPSTTFSFRRRGGCLLPPTPLRDRFQSLRLRGLDRPTFERFSDQEKRGWSWIPRLISTLRNGISAKFWPADAGFSVMAGC